MKYLRNAVALCCILFLASTFTRAFAYPIYFGVGPGYGSTTWRELVPSRANLEALSISTPVYAKEGGSVWRVLAGYEFYPSLAFEAAYTRYPDAQVFFDPDSLFTFDHNGLTQFRTRTESVSGVLKIMSLLPQQNIRPF